MAEEQKKKALPKEPQAEVATPKKRVRKTSTPKTAKETVDVLGIETENKVVAEPEQTTAAEPTPVEQVSEIKTEEAAPVLDTVKPEKKRVKIFNKSIDKNIVLWTLFGLAITIFLTAVILMSVIIAKGQNHEETPPPQDDTITYPEETNTNIRQAIYSLFDISGSDSVSDSSILKRALLSSLPEAFEYAQVSLESVNKFIDTIPTIKEDLAAIDIDWKSFLTVDQSGNFEVVDAIYDMFESKKFENIFVAIKDVFVETGITAEQFGKIMYKTLANQANVIKDNTYMFTSAIAELQKEDTENKDNVYSAMNYMVLTSIALNAPNGIASIINDENNEEIFVKAFTGLADFAYKVSNFYFDSGIADFGDIIDGIFEGEVDGAVLYESADRISKAVFALKDEETGKYINFSNEFKSVLNASIVSVKSLSTIIQQILDQDQRKVVSMCVDMGTEFMSSIEQLDTYINGFLNIMGKFFEGFTKEVSIIVTDDTVGKTTVAAAFAENIVSIRTIDETTGVATFEPDFNTTIIVANLMNGALKEANAVFTKSYLNKLIQYIDYIPTSEELEGAPNFDPDVVKDALTKLQTVTTMLYSFSNSVSQVKDGYTVVPINVEPTDPKYAEYLTFSFTTTITDREGQESEVVYTIDAEDFQAMITDYLNAFLTTDAGALQFDKKALLAVPATYIMVAVMTPAAAVTHIIAMPVLMVLERFTDLDISYETYSFSAMLGAFYETYKETMSDLVDKMFNSLIEVQQLEAA